MLTILHAGWPGGLALAGLLLLGMGGAGWHLKVAIILVPVFIYGAMLLRCRFPVSERVSAGVSYRDMLREPGALGCLIVLYMVLMEVNRTRGLPMALDTMFFDLPSWPLLIILVAVTIGYYVYTRSLGRPMYVLLLLVMILLAITELGTDTWIKDLMKPSMARLGLDSGLVLVYTASIMTVLRFCIGPIERALNPLGVLFVSSLFAAAGLYFLSSAQGILLWVMATIYGIGQCFFWPVTLGLVSERFPRGGALTLNAIAGVGMLGVGILGSQVLGFWQDTSIDRQLRETPALYEQVMQPEEKMSLFGTYRALDQAKAAALGEEADQEALSEVITVSKRTAMARVAVLPLIMAACYLGLILHFRKQGGYQAVDLSRDERKAGTG
jgi:hypothetical protein